MLFRSTSFNLRGEPIVCTPEDALVCFLRSGLDCLVLEDLLLDRAALPSAWRGWFEEGSPRKGVPDSVYTLL